MIADRTQPGSIVANLTLWSCCALATVNILTAIVEWQQFQTWLVFMILWWFELGLSCLALIIIQIARLPGWHTTVACLVVAVLFIAANSTAVRVVMP